MSATVRAAVEARAKGCCEYCLAQVAIESTPTFPIDHVMPRARGGSDDPSNLALSCQGCNGSKHAAVSHADPATGEVVPLFNPRTDRWADHFAWIADFTVIRPVTPIGRTTVDRLKLNRAGLLLQRRVLRDLGRHPPT